MIKEKLVLNRNCYLCHGLIKFEGLSQLDGISCECDSCGSYEVGENAKKIMDDSDLDSELRRDIKAEIKITSAQHRIRISTDKDKNISFSAVPINRY